MTKSTSGMNDWMNMVCVICEEMFTYHYSLKSGYWLRRGIPLRTAGAYLRLAFVSKGMTPKLIVDITNYVRKIRLAS